MVGTSEKAHEFCSWLHLQKAKVFNRLLTYDIADFIGFPEADKRWCTPWGKDVTLLTDCSQEQGGFSSTRWTMDGWVLDEASMQSLTEEFLALQHDLALATSGIPEATSTAFFE